MPIPKTLLRVAPPLFVFSVASGAAPQPVEAPRPGTSSSTAIAERIYSPEEREQAREEFIEARRAFADLLVAALTSDELIERAGEFTNKVRLERAQERLHEVKKRLRDVEVSGGAASEEARRLRDREASLQEEIALLRTSDAGPLGGETGKITAKVVAGRLHNQMSEETEYLADVLEVRELRDRARRLRRLVAVARITGGIRQLRDKPDTTQEQPPRIVPTGGTAEPKAPKVEGSLGEESDVPPEIDQ